MTKCGSYDGAISCISSLYCGAGLFMHASGWDVICAVQYCLSLAAVDVILVWRMCALHFLQGFVLFCVLIAKLGFNPSRRCANDSSDQAQAKQQTDEIDASHATKFSCMKKECDDYGVLSTESGLKVVSIPKKGFCEDRFAMEEECVTSLQLVQSSRRALHHGIASRVCRLRWAGHGLTSGTISALGGTWMRNTPVYFL